MTRITKCFLCENLYFLCLRRVTFVQRYKSNQKIFLKNFSVILFVCWFTRENGESLHPILLDSFCIFFSVISMQSDEWKIFSWRFFLFLDFWDKIDIFGIAKSSTKYFLYTFVVIRQRKAIRSASWMSYDRKVYWVWRLCRFSRLFKL